MTARRSWMQENIFNIITALSIVAAAGYNVFVMKSNNDQLKQKLEVVSEWKERMERSYPLHQQRNYNDFVSIRDFIARRYDYHIEIQTKPPYRRSE